LKWRRIFGGIFEQIGIDEIRNVIEDKGMKNKCSRKKFEWDRSGEVVYLIKNKRIYDEWSGMNFDRDERSIRWIKK
jgi:hypothetical protein